MNAERREVQELARMAVPTDEALASAAGIVVDIENKAYARGWADGVDSTAKADGGMVVAAMCAVAIIGAAVGVAIFGTILLW